jgi:hypothetical protein
VASCSTLRHGSRDYSFSRQRRGAAPRHEVRHVRHTELHDHRRVTHWPALARAETQLVVHRDTTQMAEPSNLDQPHKHLGRACVVGDEVLRLGAAVLAGIAGYS